MALSENYNLEYLVNEAERLVLEELENQLAEAKEWGICTCEECVLDMAAYALNNTKPVYRVSLMGKMYASAMKGTDYEEKIKSTVSDAIDKIKSNPSHD